MALETELKAVVDDPAALRRRLQAAGATRVRQGLMADRRYDQGGALARREEVLRLRSYRLAEDGGAEGRITWKGPAQANGSGYRTREEHEVAFAGDGAGAAALLGALGYQETFAIDRWVEYWKLGSATVRLEWYPRMDVLCEVEGEPAAIEQAIAVTGISRAAFTDEAIADFVLRYESRHGPAAISLRQLGDAPPSWATR